MIYRLHRLDGRHSHNERYQYYLEFATTMANRSGPLHFNDAMSWCIRTWGWSAEAQHTAKIRAWTRNQAGFWSTIPAVVQDMPESPPDYCNPHWSWSIDKGHDLRIYLTGDPELTWFQLAHPG